MKTPVRSTIIAAVVLTLIFASGYTLLHPAMSQQGWDSLNYAFKIETYGTRAIHGNHPLGHLFQNAALWAARSVGYAGDVFPVFLVVSGLFAGAAVGTIFLILHTLLNIEFRNAFGLAFLFGSSYGLWRYTGTADIYSYALFWAAMAWLFLIYQMRSGKTSAIGLSGVFVGLAVLTHQFNFLIALCGAYLIFRQSKDNIRAAFGKICIFLSCAGLTTIAGYLLMGYFCKSLDSFDAIFAWSRGHLSNPTHYRHFGITNIRTLFTTFLRVVLYNSSNWHFEIFKAPLVIMLMGILITAFRRYPNLAAPKKILFASAVLNCFIGALLVLWWEPGNLKFPLLLSVPGILALACGADQVESKISNIIRFVLPKGHKIISKNMFAILGVLILAFNLWAAVLKDHKPNESLETRIAKWIDYSTGDSVLITAGDLVAHLRYRNDRPNTLSIYHLLLKNKDSSDKFGLIRNEIDMALNSGETVLLAPAVVDYINENKLEKACVERDSLRKFLASYDSEAAFTYENQIDGKTTAVCRLKTSP